MAYILVLATKMSTQITSNTNIFAEKAEGQASLSFSHANLVGIAFTFCNADFFPTTLHPCASKSVGLVQIGGKLMAIKNWEIRCKIFYRKLLFTRHLKGHFGQQRNQGQGRKKSDKDKTYKGPDSTKQH
jgi:hypothetical protein